MGKRKLHHSIYYQCDWTGFPMKSAHCFMPSWTNNGKLIRRGCYCNWESVVAHAAAMVAAQEMTETEHTRVLAHIEGVVGVPVHPAPHYDNLSHQKGTMNVNDYHRACTAPTGPLVCVKIPTTDAPHEVIIPMEDGRYNFENFMHKPYNLLAAPNCFHTARKNKNDRDLTVWYYPGRVDLPPNPTASALFKLQLFGDVLIVQQSRENSFLPRTRYIGYTRAQFDDHFQKKKRRAPAEPQCVTPEAYEAMRTKMQAQLNAFEATVSAAATTPAAISKVQTKAPTTGANLAKKLKERGVVPPAKHTADHTGPPPTDAALLQPSN
jgi:hypothetical protein